MDALPTSGVWQSYKRNEDAGGIRLCSEGC